jgi:hypothetical protein
MQLNAVQLGIVCLAFLAVILAVARFSAGGAREAPRRRREGRQDVHVAEDTNPDDIPDDTAPSRSDD